MGREVTNVIAQCSSKRATCLLSLRAAIQRNRTGRAGAGGREDRSLELSHNGGTNTPRKDATMDPCRRHFLAAAPLASILGIGLLGRASAADREPEGASGSTPADAEADALWPGFPRQPADRVQELVGVCHRDIDRARALLDQHPALVNATWDWGFGDFETALGAAAHTGRRNIAELLLERGARLDIFAAAMLGQTETVRAMINAIPGIQRTPGPHGISLMAHALAGGEAATSTVAFLETLGDADFQPMSSALSDEQQRMYVGRFSSPSLGEAGVEITTNRNGDLILRIEGVQAGVLRYAGDNTFFPAGAPAVRIKFTPPAVTPQSLEIIDHATVLTASRVG